jgi:hypothetical protein
MRCLTGKRWRKEYGWRLLAGATYTAHCWAACLRETFRFSDTNCGWLSRRLNETTGHAATGVPSVLKWRFVWQAWARYIGLANAVVDKSIAESKESEY